MKIQKAAAIYAALLIALGTAWAAEPAGFALRDKPGDSLDILLDGRIAARYMYARDTSSSERAHETYKPYLHVFDAEGKAPITKGPGGYYTHHRGIMTGYMHLGCGGRTYDFWTMSGKNVQVHQKFLDQKAGRDEAVVTSLIDWNTSTGQTIVRETRTMIFRRAPEPFRLAIDYSSRLAAVGGDVVLDAINVEHGGIHYRPANEIETTATVYFIPREKVNPRTDVDYPWVGETYKLMNGKQYSVLQLNDPANPKQTLFSANRDYGRFGAFPRGTIRNGASLTLRYGFLIAEGVMPGVDKIQQAYDQFTGATNPGAVPKITVMPAPKPPAPKKVVPKKDSKRRSR